MNQDPLDEALRALRDEGGEPAAPRAAEVTRDRIMFALHREQRRRLSRLSVVLPLVAVLAGSTVWAAGSGRLAAAVRAVQALVAPGTVDAPPEPAAPRAPRGRGGVTSPEPREAQGPAAGGEVPPPSAAAPAVAPGEVRAEPTPSPPGAAGASARGAGGAGAHGAGGAGGASAATPVESRADTLYREAHRLHFGGGAPGAALAAWDAYLREAPRGRFATEARYNRALTLVRLGRTAEARSALEPFARARAGSYRQAEAAALLEALGAP